MINTHGSTFNSSVSHSIHSNFQKCCQLRLKRRDCFFPSFRERDTNWGESGKREEMERRGERKRWSQWMCVLLMLLLSSLLFLLSFPCIFHSFPFIFRSPSSSPSLNPLLFLSSSSLSALWFFHWTSIGRNLCARCRHFICNNLHSFLLLCVCLKSLSQKKDVWEAEKLMYQRKRK